MKPKLILLSHGLMAKETLSSARMILGDLANAYAMEMKAEDGLSGTKEKLDEVLSQIDENQDIVIMTDLKGGTPCNAAMMSMAERSGIYVLSGLNLGMLIEACVSSIEDSEELVDYLVKVGKEAVERIEFPVDADDCEEE